MSLAVITILVYSFENICMLRYFGLNASILQFYYLKLYGILTN